MKPKVLLLALLAQFLTLSASAYDAVVNGIYYNLDTTNKTAEVTHGINMTSYSGSVTIPSNITYNNTSFKVTAIGADAFYRCTNLTYISIPTSIISIENNAFYGCTGLTGVSLPASVKTIGRSAFSGCTGLTGVSLPTTVKTIGEYAFNGCTGLTSFKIPGSVTKIMYGVFNDCSNLTSINIPPTVSFIESAFQGTPWFDSWLANQPDGPCYINTVLYKYKGTMPANTSVIVNEGTTCIGGSAFEDCTNLVSIDIPQSVTSICSKAFAGCGLKSISIPTSLTYLGSGAFMKCNKLSKIEIPAFTESGGYVHYKSSTYLASGNHPGGWLICAGCTSLTSAALAEGIEKISANMFVDCYDLASVTLPSTIKTFDGYDVFANCDNLSAVRASMQVPPSIGSELFTTRFFATLIVPDGCKSAYEAAEYWQEFKEIKEESEVGGDEPEPIGEDTDISTLNNIIYLNKTDGFVGQEQTLSFQMKNTAAIRGFQFDLYLPEGVTAVKNAKGRIQGSLSSGRLPEEDEHTLTIQEQADGAIRFLCSSLYDETFTGSEGEIATLQVKIGENLEDGDYPIIIKDMKLTETNISNFYETSYLKSTLTVSSFTPGDVNGDAKVDVSDYTGVANHILGIAQEVFIEKAGDVDGSSTIDVSDYTGIANFIMTGSFSGRSNLKKVKGLAGGSEENVIYVQDAELPVADASGVEVELLICMKNSADIRGFQFDMYLPEGFTVVKNNKGRIIASLSSGRLPEDDEHTLTVQEQADGAIRFLCSSLYDETFTGTDGEIATVKIKIAENITAGDYPIQLKNMKLTETNISNYYETELMESVFKITGSSTTPIRGDVNEDGKVDIADVVVVLQIMAGK